MADSIKLDPDKLATAADHSGWPAIAFDDNSLREAADHMVREGIGRLPVIIARIAKSPDG